MPSQTFTGLEGAEASPASFTAVANTVTRTNLWTPNLWTFINPFTMRAGKTYELSCGGIISATAAPTIVFNPTFGQSGTPTSNLALGATTTFAVGTITTAPWNASFKLVVRSLGVAASGSTVTGNGFVVISGAAAAVSQVVAMGGTVVATADHTTAQGLCLDVTWGTAAAGNTITCQWAELKPSN
jgi:hypothetical protein